MPTDSDLSTLIGVLEETIDMNVLDKRFNRLRREKNTRNREEYTSKTKESPATNPTTLEVKKTPESKEKVCWNCNQTGHVKPDCSLSRKRINFIEGEEYENTEPHLNDNDGSLSDCDLIITNPINVIEGSI